MTPHLIIFDCDGVLVDSESIACRVDAECLTEFGFPITAQDIMQRYVGRSASFMFKDIETRFERRLPGNVPTALRTRLAVAFETELKAIEGIDAVLARLTVPACVASSSEPARIENSLRITGLLHYFRPRIFSATEVARGKPAPDLFLFAAKQMHIAPEDCIVIEDSLAGVEAACAAGMRSIGFTGGSHCSAGHAELLRAAGAATVIAQMTNLVGAIEAA